MKKDPPQVSCTCKLRCSGNRSVCPACCRADTVGIMGPASPKRLQHTTRSQQRASTRAKQCQSDAVPKAVLPCPWHTLMQPSAKALRKQEQRQSSLSAGLHVLSIFLYLLTFLLELTAFSFSFTWKPFSNPSEAGFEGISCFSTHCHPNFKTLQSYCFNNSYDKI